MSLVNYRGGWTGHPYESKEVIIMFYVKEQLNDAMEETVEDSEAVTENSKEAVNESSEEKED